jgi:hypothetical protein
MVKKKDDDHVLFVPETGEVIEPVSFVPATHDFYKPGAPDVAIYDWGPSLTRQEFAEDCDINVIMTRFERTGQLPANGAAPVYLDLTAMPSDLMTTLNLLDDAERAFMSLPATVRREFDNDATKFVDFASDSENVAQMRTWGLAPPLEEPLGPQLVRVVPEDPAPAPTPGPASKAP